MLDVIETASREATWAIRQHSVTHSFRIYAEGLNVTERWQVNCRSAGPFIQRVQPPVSWFLHAKSLGSHLGGGPAVESAAPIEALTPAAFSLWVLLPFADP